MSTNLRKTPWSAYSGEDTNGWFVIHDADGYEIGSTDGGFEEDEARMFAAAPDLADALKEIVAAWPRNVSILVFNGLVENARAALAKAGAE